MPADRLFDLSRLTTFALPPVPPARSPWVLLGVLGVLLAACGGKPTPEPTRQVRPWNVVMVLADTLRADHLGVYGYARDTSPRIDELAQRGIVFENAVSQASCTFPSVNSILTSRYPVHFVGQEGSGMGIPEGIPSLAEILKAAGWSTFAVSASPIVRATPSHRNPDGGFGRGFDIFDESCEWRPAGCVERQALELLAKAEQPLFLYLHFMDPHDPYQPPPEHPRRFAGEYRGKEFIAHGNPNPIAEWLYSGGPDPGLGEGDLQHLVDLYDDSIAYFDTRFGELMAELESRGLLDRTLVVLVADHGEEFLEHGHIKHCRTVYETELHIPMLFWLPGAVEGRRVSPVVQNLDLVPTILDDLGLEVAGHGFEGASLRPLLEGEETEAETAARLGFGWQATHRSVRDRRFKLVYDFSNHLTFFDLETDSAEQTEVAREHRRDLARLRQALTRWVDEREPELLSERLRRGEEFEQKLEALGYLK